MKVWNRFQGPRRAGLAPVASLTLLLWVWTLALATFPQLHARLHCDAQNSSHVCLVSEMHQHSLLAGFSASVVPTPILLTVPEPVAPEYFVLSSDHDLLPPGRAPPSSPVTSEVAS